jgi:hypothetical protein
MNLIKSHGHNGLILLVPELTDNSHENPLVENLYIAAGYCRSKLHGQLPILAGFQDESKGGLPTIAEVVGV